MGYTPGLANSIKIKNELSKKNFAKEKINNKTTMKPETSMTDHRTWKKKPDKSTSSHQTDN